MFSVEPIHLHTVNIVLKHLMGDCDHFFIGVLVLLFGVKQHLHECSYTYTLVSPD